MRNYMTGLSPALGKSFPSSQSGSAFNTAAEPTIQYKKWWTALLIWPLQQPNLNLTEINSVGPLSKLAYALKSNKSTSDCKGNNDYGKINVYARNKSS